ncbi:unnamed protein product [Phaeothamnion confervicola]
MIVSRSACSGEYSVDLDPDTELGFSWSFNGDPLMPSSIFAKTTKRVRDPALVVSARATYDVPSTVAKLQTSVASEYGKLEGSCDSLGRPGPLRYSNGWEVNGRHVSVSLVRDLLHGTDGSAKLSADVWPKGPVAEVTLHDDGAASVVARHSILLGHKRRFGGDTRLGVRASLLPLAQEGPYALGSGVFAARVEHETPDARVSVEISDARKLGWELAAGDTVVQGTVPLDDPQSAKVSVRHEVRL